MEALYDELQQSIEKLNSEFEIKYSTLISKTKELNDITDELESMHKATGGITGATCNITNMIKQTNMRETIEMIISDFQKTINPLIEDLNTISNTAEKLQQAEQTYSVQNKVTMTSVRSVKTILSITKNF